MGPADRIERRVGVGQGRGIALAHDQVPGRYGCRLPRAHLADHQLRRIDPGDKAVRGAGDQCGEGHARPEADLENPILRLDVEEFDHPEAERGVGFAHHAGSEATDRTTRVSEVLADDPGKSLHGGHLLTNGALDRRETAFLHRNHFLYPPIILPSLDVRRRLVEAGAAPATANLALAALRGVARESWRAGLLPREEYDRIRDVPRVRGSRLPAGRSATGGELAALLATCARDPSPAGIRDGALLALLYGAGLRRAELAALGRGDWVPDGWLLRVLGKGDKEREVPLPPGAVAALEDWLAVRGDWDGALFPPLNKGGRVARRRMSEQAVYAALAKRAAAAGVDDLSPHDLRRTYVGDLLDRGADIATVQRLAGHADVSTTARYDRRGGGVADHIIWLFRNLAAYPVTTNSCR